MFYICIPVHNEAPTIGLLLWRIRKVFQDLSRDYEVLVYDDGSTDATHETLEPYTQVLPLTILGSRERVGYAGAMDALLREASRRTRYPRRDAVISLQGDFTDQPEHLNELIKRFEGGADVVVAERPVDQHTPQAVRRMQRVAPWILRPFASVPGVGDAFGALRLYRVSLLRDLAKANADAPFAQGPVWAANADLLMRVAPFARRLETVELAPRYDLRPRETRIRPLRDAVDLFKFGRASRARWSAARAS